jgi:hypothetical protein
VASSYNVSHIPYWIHYLHHSPLLPPPPFLEQFHQV